MLKIQIAEPAKTADNGAASAQLQQVATVVKAQQAGMFGHY